MILKAVYIQILECDKKKKQVTNVFKKFENFDFLDKCANRSDPKTIESQVIVKSRNPRTAAAVFRFFLVNEVRGLLHRNPP